MTSPGSPEAIILVLPERRGGASAVQICIACCITPAKVRSHLVMLESMRLVFGRYDTSVPPRRVYALTDEGRLRLATQNRRT